jgi:hypothetical protein
MTRDEALDVVIAAAERWAENAKVAFLAGSTRTTPTSAAVASSVLFGLYHFTHSTPWNNWAQAARLSVLCFLYA